jgi:hypothetical protein
MDNSLFNKGNQIKLQVARQDGDWYVKQSEVPGETICMFQTDSPEGGTELSVPVEVVSYHQGVGDSKNYLTVELLAGQSEDSITNQDSSADSDGSRTPNKAQSTPNQDKYPDRSLSQFNGSGDYVTIEAEIAAIKYVKKEARDMPDLKGVIKQRGSVKKLPFVVSDETSHPYLEEGKRFRFIGVKDHVYEHMSEVQALITEETEFVEL